MSKLDYPKVIENSLILFKQMFGDELYKSAHRKHLKPIDFQGLDITDCSVLQSFPSIKERFTEEWIEYFKERKFNWLEMFIQAVYHYGIEVGERKKSSMDNLMEKINDSLIDEIHELREINKQLTEELNKLTAK